MPSYLVLSMMAFALASAGASTFAASPYEIINLGTLPYPFQPGERWRTGSVGTAISPDGIVAGVSSSGEPVYPGLDPPMSTFVASPGSMQDRGRITYSDPRLRYLNEVYPSVTGINRSGEIVGASFVTYLTAPEFQPRSLPWRPTYFGDAPRAFLTDAGGIHDLGTLPGDNRSWALGISDDRQVIGVSQLVDVANVTRHRSFLYANGSMQDFGSLIDPDYGFTNPLAIEISASGRILAEAEINGQRQNFVYANGQVELLGPAHPEGLFQHISDSGDAFAGAISSGNLVQPVLFKDGVLHQLESFSFERPVFGGQTPIMLTFEARYLDVVGVTSSGQVFGHLDFWNALTGDYGPIPYLYHDGELSLLPELMNTDAWDIDSYAPLTRYLTITDVNDAGEISGIGALVNGGPRAFLMRPIPEPGSFLLALVGLAGFACYRLHSGSRQEK